MKRILIIAAIALLATTGCDTLNKPINPNAGQDNSYYTSSNMSALEYSHYLARKISVATGQINTHMNKIHNVVSGSCSYENEVQALDSSIKTLKEDKKDLNYVYPPDEYARTRENALTYWQDAVDIMQEMKDELSTGNPLDTDKAATYASRLKDIYTSIQSLNFTV